MPYEKVVFVGIYRVFVVLVQCLGGCISPSSDDIEDADLFGYAFDISGYIIVYPEGANEKTMQYVSELAESIYTYLEVELPVTVDTVAETEEEILIGRTNRKLSNEKFDELNSKEYLDGDAFAIEISDGKIALVGKSSAGDIASVKHFIRRYVMTSGYPSHVDVSRGKSIWSP